MESWGGFASTILHAIESPDIQDLDVGTVTSDFVASHVLVEDRPSVRVQLLGVYVGRSV